MHAARLQRNEGHVPTAGYPAPSYAVEEGVKPSRRDALTGREESGMSGLVTIVAIVSMTTLGVVAIVSGRVFSAAVGPRGLNTKAR